MSSPDRIQLVDWTVDYGSGQSAITVPHAWRQDVPVTWEGPAIYRATVEPDPSSDRWIVFHGVSYEAVVRVNGAEAGIHRGIWDAFAFRLPSSTDPLQIEVSVTKNGGARFPVRDVASGFLPFVFHTFGGIFKRVEVVRSLGDPTIARAALDDRQPVTTSGTRLVGKAAKAKPAAKDLAAEWLVRRSAQPLEPDKGAPTGISPLYLRGVLTWGWYPELGHPNPPDETIRREIEIAKGLGFNLVKFCLWVPSHRYLELLHDAGMWAWIELPLWDPTPDTDLQDLMASELETIVRQYAHHANIALWTCGCELHESTSARYRQRLVELTKGCFPPDLAPPIKDNSGSAEMYGGDLREFGDFYDFHPYCDTPFFPGVLDSLLVGPRRQLPILLGEFNDIDLHRDLPRLAAEAPYWTSQDSALNDQGVRWQHDLPSFLPNNRFATNPGEHRHDAVAAASKSKAIFIRKFVQEAVRARADFAGYVVTGWRDTPISTSGVVDDWGEPRFTREDLAQWNGPACLFQIPTRRPPWVRGGNRVGSIDPFNWFVGRVFWRIGVHAETDLEGTLEWDVLHFSWENGKRPQGRVANGLCEPVAVSALDSREVGQISWDAAAPGGYLLRVRFAGVENSWPIWVVPKLDRGVFERWRLDDPQGHFEDGSPFGEGEERVVTTRFGDPGVDAALAILSTEGTKPMPFWRESAYEFANAAFWDAIGYREHWERLLSMTPDCALDGGALRDSYPGFQWETLLNRIDARTYTESPIVVSGSMGTRRMIVTTLRPFGGLGCCPKGIRRNPSGAEFLTRLLKTLAP